MRARDDSDFIPYQDRELPWARDARRTPGPSARDGTDGRPRASVAGGCLRGCGCLLLMLVIGGIALYLGVRALPGAGPVALNVLVENAIDGRIKSRGETVTVPPPWHAPWRATARAFGRAYDEGAVSRETFLDMLGATFMAVASGGGEIPDSTVRELCETMRDALPPEVRAQLPPFPAPPLELTTPATAHGGSWAAWEALDPAERDRQYAIRRNLLATLSRLHGPATAQQLVPEDAIVFDFRYDVPPYPGLMDEWELRPPPDGTMEVAMQPKVGFGSPPSISIAATPAARAAANTIAFTTGAGSLQFWYRFEGRAAAASQLSVRVDGLERHTDPWPTANAGSLVSADWRHVHLTGLADAAPARIEIRAEVTGTDRACFLYMDDLVFAP